MQKPTPDERASFAMPEHHPSLQEPQQPSRQKSGTTRRSRFAKADTGSIHLSVIIPVYNERQNLPALLRRVEQALVREPYGVECIVVDDRSTDDSVAYLRRRTHRLPLRILEKQGKRGKAQSILEGAAAARGAVIAMIDGDLQYPPEAIPTYVRRIGEVDIVVARRTERRTSRLRSVLSAANNVISGRLLFGLRVDVQSGLKVFRREILRNLSFMESPWGFDFQFLYQAKRSGWTMGEEPIVFEERFHGTSHVRAFRDGIALLKAALAFRARYLVSDILPFLAAPHAPKRFADGYDNDADFLFMADIFSVKKQVTKETTALAIVGISSFVLAVMAAAVLLGTSALVVVSGIIAVFYVGLIAFKLLVIRDAVRHRPIAVRDRDIARLTDDELPSYTILIPLYKEASVIPQIRAAMTAIDYPADKLDVIITLEEYDHATRAAIDEADFPPHFRILTLPDVEPKTKPKALNVAFRDVHGDFLVIYDAEIIPDPDQLKKAVVAFRSHPDIACLQTRLDHYNAHQNWVTKLFNAEFTFYYDLFLPGLQARGYPLPLSGHSTHFRVDALRDIGAWDPYNVTEDCDVGIRLYRKGYRSALLDAFSREEATNSVRAWTLQRSRWVKGFVQSSLVHLRHPLRLKEELGSWRNVLAFLLIVPGSVLVNVLNLVYWALLILWMTAQPQFIRSLFPAVILYPSMVAFVAGNFLFTYCNLLGSFQRRRYVLVKYSLLSPLYWIMLSYATVRGISQMLLRPHAWEKTEHGTHLVSQSYAIPLAPRVALPR